MQHGSGASKREASIPMLTWTVRWHQVQAELNMKLQRTKLPSSTDISCYSVVRSSVVSTKNPEASPERSRDIRTYPPSEMEYDRGCQQLLFNSPILLPLCFRPHPTAGCHDSLSCHLQAQPKVRALKPENCWETNIIYLHICCFLL